jgi:lysozyme family protein
MDPRFQRAIDLIIATHEGGFQKRADDAGNWTGGATDVGELKGTKFGISAHAFPDLDIENMTLAQAEQIFFDVYGHVCQIVDDRVMCKTLDLEVNMQWGDKGAGTLILQRAIVELGIPVNTDGVLGPRTAIAAGNVNSGNLLNQICKQAVLYYQKIEAAHPERAAWFKVWNKRATWIPPVDAFVKLEEHNGI